MCVAQVLVLTQFVHFSVSEPVPFGDHLQVQKADPRHSALRP